ncbi:MAG: hypothetical protein RLZZ223_552 [Candidatus Parcubacteria bacterium]|jgi:large subunit ribosomal protein L25
MKKEALSLLVESRAKQGTVNSVVLRSQGIVPGVIYGGGLVESTSEMIQVNVLDLQKILSEIEESTLVNIILNGRTYPSLVKDIQRNPLKSEILSVDFFAPNLNEEVETPVTLEFNGISQSEKAGNILVKIHQEVEVRALPNNLPDSIIVDISKLDSIDDVIRVSDLHIPNGVTILLDPDELIAITEVPDLEEEPELTKEEIDALEKSQAEKNSKDKKEN